MSDTRYSLAMEVLCCLSTSPSHLGEIAEVAGLHSQKDVRILLDDLKTEGHLIRVERLDGVGNAAFIEPRGWHYSWAVAQAYWSVAYPPEVMREMVAHLLDPEHATAA